jgi:endonuclease-8
MPEGPSIVILKEEIEQSTNKKIISVAGNSKQDIQRLAGKKIISFKSWGKHFLICFKGFSVRIHFLLFGKYAVNDRKVNPPRLALLFKKGEINFYSCSVQFIEQDLDEVYDWSADVMNDSWNAKAAKKKLLEKPDVWVTDALLDQNIFAGVGNIIKNEVLYRTGIHPENKVGDLPIKKLNDLIKQARVYSFDFLEWKKAFVLRKHWKAHTKKICPKCGNAIVKKYLGKTNRRTFFCTSCQVLYS